MASTPPQPSWVPPPLSSLNFSSDCTLVLDYYHTWFRALDVSNPDPGSHPLQLPWNKIQKPWYFVADDLESSVVDRYFRTALLLSLSSSSTSSYDDNDTAKQQQPSTGQIIDWEISLRGEYRRQRDENAPGVLAILQEVNPKVDDDRYDKIATSFRSEYFTVLLDKPGESCYQKRCYEYRPARLGDVNGPGVFITYWLQLIMMVAGSIIVMVTLFRCSRRGVRPATTPVPATKGGRISSSTTVANAALSAVTPLVQTLTLFSLTTSYVLIIEFANKSFHYFPPRDRSIALCSCGLALVMSFWGWRLNHCICHIQRRTSQQQQQQQQQQQEQQAEIDSPPLRDLPLLVFIAVIAPAGFFRWVKFSGPPDAYGWDDYMDTFCNYRRTPDGVSITLYGDFIWAVQIICVVRIVALNKPVLRLLRALVPRRQETAGFYQLPSSENHQRNQAVLDMMDLFVCIVFGTTVTVIFTLYSHPLYFIAEDFASGQWNFGQFLALTTIIPVLLEFLRSLNVFETADGNVNIFSFVGNWTSKRSGPLGEELEIRLGNLRDRLTGEPDVYGRLGS